jgi:hypothetical protein
MMGVSISPGARAPPRLEKAGLRNGHAIPLVLERIEHVKTNDLQGVQASAFGWAHPLGREMRYDAIGVFLH